MAKAPSSGKPLTLVEVAQRLGVSKSTVSAAFTGRGTITAARREAVKSAAVELGYEPNPHAQQLVHGSRSDMICLCAPNLGAGDFTRVIELLQYAIVQRGIVAPIHLTGVHPSEVEYQITVFRSLRLQRPRAIVCCVRRLLPELRKELERYMAAGGILIAAEGYASEDIGSDWVRHDGKYNAYVATKYLLDNGHKKIGIYLPSPGVLARPDAEDPIYEGYLQAHREFGITPRPDWLVRRSYYEDGGTHMAKVFLALEERPSAMFIVNDNAASAFVQQLYRAGLSVPRDVSVVGHDDAAVAAACMTPLTTVSWPIRSMVDELEKLLFSRIENGFDGVRREVIVRGELRVRESVMAIS
ncbi:MAG: LacI family DNA-binding transcriptional regulator [Capsulimonadaceae bacterium]|nr:LacI family DNA-binding transcriptional regulator [Capsulimonadaceae bacterium]